MIRRPLVRVLVAVGIAWPNSLAAFAMCISASLFATAELVSLLYYEALARTLVVLDVRRWVEISGLREQHLHDD